VIANDYLHERAQAVQDIEAHMTELGSIFERLSTMITEQGEMIDRLDDNLDAAEVNVNMGYQEIVKYGQNVYEMDKDLMSSFSNRSLIMKLFGVLIFFIIFFLIFLA
jgi:syntaxin 5A